jgi:outer membrane receptor protein involved in Fe transport
LRRYGYDEHYNRYDTDVSSDTFGQVSEPKKTRVPGFWQLDASHRFAIAKNYALTMRVNNILDYTQTRDADDSPTTWHWHVNHAHYDNFHTWGPLTGRQYFVGLEAQW